MEGVADIRTSYFMGPFPPRPGMQNLTSARDCWEFTKSCFKEDDKIFSKNSTTEENITILRLK